jgi:hypothetical protein
VTSKIGPGNINRKISREPGKTGDLIYFFPSYCLNTASTNGLHFILSRNPARKMAFFPFPAMFVFDLIFQV